MNACYFEGAMTLRLSARERCSNPEYCVLGIPQLRKIQVQESLLCQALGFVNSEPCVHFRRKKDGSLPSSNGPWPLLREHEDNPLYRLNTRLLPRLIREPFRYQGLRKPL